MTRKTLSTGRTIIVDNGVYEGERLGNLELAAVLEEFQGFTEFYYIVPDWPHDFEKNEQLLQDWFTFWNVRNHGRNRAKPLKVLHSEPGGLLNFLKSYRLAKTQNVKGVCFSRLVDSFGKKDDQQMTRYDFVRMLQVLGEWEPLWCYHALGFKGLEDMRQMGALGIDSLDSSAPVWRGLNGFHFQHDDQCLDARNRLWEQVDVPLDILADTSIGGSPSGMWLAWSNLKAIEEQGKCTIWAI